ADTVTTSFYDPFNYVGIVGGEKITNSHGVNLFASSSGESCVLLNPRPNHHLFEILLDPTEVPSGGGTITFAPSLNTVMFVSEVDESNNFVRQAIAEKG